MHDATLKIVKDFAACTQFICIGNIGLYYQWRNIIYYSSRR